MDFATRADLTGRLRGLVILLEDRLPLDLVRAVEALIDAADFGAALEMLAEFLATSATRVPNDVRRDFERLAFQLGTVERVMSALQLCPPEDGGAY